MPTFMSGRSRSIKPIVMSYFVSELLSYSIIPAAFLGLYNYRKVTERYRVFIWYLWLSLFSEVVSSILIYYLKNNIYSNNVFILTEWLLLGYFYYVLTVSKLQKRIYKIILIVLTLLWLWEHIIYSDLGWPTHIFRIIYAVALVFMSINQLNALIVTARKSIFKNALFIICCTCIFYFSYKAIVEVLYSLPYTFSDTFVLTVLYIPLFINLVCNVFYFIACLCLPTRQEFFLRY